MKRYIFLSCIVALALSSCTFGFNPMGYEVKHGDLESSWRHVASFEYQYDPEGYWKSPMEFERDGGGDCEDFATDLMYYLGPESQLYIVKLYWSDSYHAIVYYNGKFLESEVYGMYYDGSEFIVEQIFSYKDVMQSATDLGRKDIK